MKQSKYVSLLLIVMMISVAIAVPMASAQSETVNATVVPDVLFMRAEPSASGEILLDLGRGTQLTVSFRETNDNDGGSWVYVTPEGTDVSGWVLALYLQFPEGYNIGNLDPIDPDTVTTTSAPTASDASDEASEDEDETTTTTNTTVTAVSGDVVVIPGSTNEVANFRSGPELTFEILDQLARGTDVLLTGRTANSVWLQAIVDGQIGWIFFSLVTADGDVDELQVPESFDQVPSGIVVSADNTVTVTTTEDTPVTEDGESPVVVASSGSRPAFLGVSPQSSGNDGRLNPTDSLGGALIYCVDGDNYTDTRNYSGGGIAVYLFANDQIPFFATEAEINRVPANSTSGGTIKAEGNYVLYRVGTNGFALTGPDDKGQPFTFSWENCNTGSRTD